MARAKRRAPRRAARPKKRLAKRGKGSARPGRAAPRRDLPADSLVFSITWSEQSEPATLPELRYNEEPVDDRRVSSPGKITVTFTRPVSAIHRFAWDLFFPKRKLRNLDAGAALNGADSKSLNSAKDATDHWAERGEL